MVIKMKQITVRNISPNLAQALDRARKIKGKSLNRTVIELLMQALGLTADQTYDNGLDKLAGSSSQEEFEDFEKNTVVFEQIDEELWR